ncbi:unnamed protein product [Plutella xylostella]|uniref:tRNA-uridine aminocarboxypropyltransferase 1 n=1 Tax=Plutella xylostella TaxID=51655 RepID=A0A8S4E271_PLUXY|nr:unnamed protein product [Plutella xylostella]
MNPKSPEARNRDDKPFEGMKITNSHVLEKLDQRSACTRCGKSRMYFCYTCYIPVADLKDCIPHCKLPVKVDIIKHKKEIDGKSTSAHAAVLAPEDVKVYTYPDVPDYTLDGKTVLLYPGVEAKTVPQLFQENNNTTTILQKVQAELPAGYNLTTLLRSIVDLDDENKNQIYHVTELPINRIVLIDSTWNQSKGIYADRRLQSLPKVVLQNRASQFWRHQKGSPRWYLSTVEALHQLMLELHLCAWGCSEHYKSLLTIEYPIHSSKDQHDHCTPYAGQYDNLLFFFKYMYDKLHSLYNHENLLAYKRPME